MKIKDYYEDICKYYETVIGNIPERAAFKEALKEIIAEKYLKTYSFLPKFGNISFSKLQKKSKLPEDELLEHVKTLAIEGIIMIYKKEGELHFERRDIIGVTEEQIRKPDDSPSPYRDLCARIINCGIEGEFETPIKTKTPFYRVIPSEQSITKTPGLRTIDVDIDLPDPEVVLPLDKITEMIKNEAKVIAVAKCYCRMTKGILGQECEYPLETCLSFNEYAQTFIEIGCAREIGYEEAIQIVEDCDKRGLVHAINNCYKEIRTLCNCCQDCCIIQKSMKRGEKYAGTTSRYVAKFESDKCNTCLSCLSRCPRDVWQVNGEVVSHDPDKCIGCGLCVSTCPTGAISMVLRKTQKKIPVTYKNMSGKIMKEAAISIVKNKIFGR